MVIDKLNILILHSLGNPKLAPGFLGKHVFSLQINYPEHNYLYHDAALPIPEYVKQTKFDAIILDVTFLHVRWAGDKSFAKRLNDYRFVAESDSVKIAFPQDEYDCHISLDNWMCDWKIDVVFSVISSGWDVLYPKYSKQGEIRLGYTGYIDEALLDWVPKAFSDRAIDIGYRARKLLPYFGRLGEVKWTIGRDVAVLARDAGLNVDIVLGTQGTLLGRKWLDFINDSKFTLGANSGSSLLDPVGSIQKAVKLYALNNPNACFEEIEAACFPGQDGKHQFTAISPRVFEAALLESCQILVEGEYSNIIKPWRDYIPIRSDASNFNEVIEAIRDVSFVKKITKNCKDSILSVDNLRYKNSTQSVLDLVVSKIANRKCQSSHENIDRVIKRYQNEMHNKYRLIWAFQGGRQLIKNSMSRSKILSYMLNKRRCS